jgi:Kef-type K+ transport system membrane component KefB
MIARSERGFGALGDVLSVFLFVSVAGSVHWQLATESLVFGLALVLIRSAAKIFALGILSIPSGVTVNKGALTGLAMSPLSVFVILTLEQTRYLGINLLNDLSALAAAALILEIFGPLLTLLALKFARELPDKTGD